MAGSGIWLDDDTYAQTAGQMWAQQAHAQLQAGEDWAQQAMRAAIAPAQDALSKLQSMVPALPQTAPAPAPAAPSMPTPAPEPLPEPPPTPAPAQPPLGVTQTPVSEPGPPLPTLTPEPMTPPPELPQLPTVPTPTATPSPTDMQSAGQTWAQQQINNLLNPAQASPQTPSTPAAPSAAAPGMDTSTALPSATPGAPAGPQPTTAGDLIDQTRQAAIKAGIDPDIFSRQINQESGFNPNAQSGAGAQGIAQFMPGTAKGLGINPLDPGQALPAAANLMKSYLDKYGGDWSKALAAYNAGPGNVDQYGGVPPFGETQNYVKTILGGAQNVVQKAAETGQTAVNTAVQGVQSAVARTSQFGLGLSSGDAMAFCGPAAALAFAQTYGRNPTVDEAKQLAQQVGWNPSQGMAGVGSEVKLLNAMGVDAHATQGVDWAQVGRDASGGNPVIIDTPGHYYYVDGYNADSGKFHVGTSGTDLRGGSEWMSADQINGMPQSGGNARAAIFADHPLSGPGQAATMAQNQPASASSAPDLSGALSAGGSALNTLSALGQIAPDFGTGALLQQGQRLSASLLWSPEVQSKAQNVAQAVLDVGGAVTQGVGRTTQDLLQQAGNLPSIVGTDISQAPQSISDMLTSNALLSQGIPTIQGALGAQTPADAEARWQAAQQAAQQQTGAGVTIPTNPLDLLGGMSPFGVGAAGEQLTNERNQAIEQANPLRDIPFIGGASTLAAQTALDPTALLLGAGPELGRAALPAAADVLGNAAMREFLGGESGQLNLRFGGGGAPLAPAAAPPPPTSPISVGDWLRGFYRGGVISSPATMADVAMNSGAGPIISTLTGALGDVLTGTAAPGRLAGRALGTASGSGRISFSTRSGLRQLGRTRWSVVPRRDSSGARPTPPRVGA